MKKILIAGGIVIVIALYVIFANHSNTPAMAQPAIDNGGTGITDTQTSSSSGTSTGGTANIANQWKDGSYTGPVTDAIYGKLQVVVIIQNGELVDVQFPTYPNSAGHTIQLSQQVLPELKQEAITVQSANVNIVSGATQTSQAFQQSLAAALAMAK